MFVLVNVLQVRPHRIIVISYLVLESLLLPNLRHVDLITLHPVADDRIRSYVLVIVEYLVLLFLQFLKGCCVHSLMVWT